MWYVYLLVNSKDRRTYIGATTSPERRIRQHNREIVGGARSTFRNAPYWKIACYVSGFTGRQEAYRWEKILKLRARGFQQRQEYMELITQGKCPGKGKYYLPPEKLVYTVLEECTSQHGA
jgi:predicted GIY-YIG superfamily endonuclease